MIQPNKVRIGNWVMYEGKSSQIHGLSKNYAFFKIDEFKEVMIEWKNLEPIPITDEWLVKFGFKQMGTFRQFYISEEEYNVWVTDFNMSVDDKPNMLDPKFKKPKYIHQLQNIIFAITGEELKIKEALN